MCPLASGPVPSEGPSSPAAPARTPPALVIGSGISALGVVRALGRGGIAVYVLNERPGPVRGSRWYRPPPDGRLLATPDALAEFLEDGPFDSGVLIAASDEAALAVAALPAHLAARFPSSQAPGHVLEDLVDKSRFRALLERHGVPHPRTLTVDGDDPVGRLDDAAVENLFIKPVDSQTFYRRFHTKGFRPGTRDALRARLAELREAGVPVVLQEYVPGPAENHCFLDGFVDRRGRVTGLLARRRLHMHPEDFGSSCATVSVPREELASAEAELVRLFAETGYRGLFDAEFKEDARSGGFRLIEINARAWWQLEFAVHCGVDVVSMAYRDALGQPVEEASDYRVGQRWIMPYNDFFACKRRWRAGELSTAGWIRFCLGARWAGFALDDPMPAVEAAADRIRDFVGRRLA